MVISPGSSSPARGSQPQMRSALLLCCLVQAPADRIPLAAYNYMEVAKLTAADAAAEDWFGGSVAIDGDTVVVGARRDYDGGSNSGSVYVFRTSDGGATYVEVAKLTASDAAPWEYFGRSMAIDGDTVVVGAYGGEAAYVFRTADGGATYGQVAKLTASDGAAYDYFGGSVAIDGATVVVGAFWDDDAGYKSGSAYVFHTSDGGTTYDEVTKLTAADGATWDYFGRSVAIDGNTVVIGAISAGTGGAVYVFRTTDGGATYSQVAKLTAADAAAYDWFGHSVAIDGTTIVVGAYGDDDVGGANSGSAYVFRTTDGGATYVQVAKLTASDAAVGDYFGYSVAIDGDRVVVGASEDDDAGSASGSAYVFDANAPTSQPTTSRPTTSQPTSHPTPRPSPQPTAQPTAQPTKQVDVLAPWEIALLSIAGFIFCVGGFVCLHRMRKSQLLAKTSPTVPEIETPPMLRTTSVLPMGTVEAVQAPDAPSTPPILGEVVTHSTVLSVSN